MFKQSCITMDSGDRKKMWNLDATSPPHSSVTSADGGFLQQELHTRSNTDASNGGGYTTSGHSHQSTPNSPFSGKSNVTTINHYSNEVTLIDLSMPPPPLPPPMPGKLNATCQAAGVGFSSASSSAASTDAPPSSVSLTNEIVFKRPYDVAAAGSGQNYFRTRDHAYAHQLHPPIHAHYPPLQPIQHYNAADKISAGNSKTQLVSTNNDPSLKADQQLLLRRPESSKPASTSSTSSGSAAFRTTSLTRRISLLNKPSSTSSSAPFPPKRFSNVDGFKVYSNNSSAMLSPRSLSSTALPTTQVAAQQIAITEELKARNLARNNGANFSTISKLFTQPVSKALVQTNTAAPVRTLPASALTTVFTSSRLTSTSTETITKLPPPQLPTSNTVTSETLGKKVSMDSLQDVDGRNERASASVKQIIQTIEQQLMSNDNFDDADKQLDDLEKALEARSPTSDCGVNDYAPSLDVVISNDKREIAVGGESGGGDDTDGAHDASVTLPCAANVNEMILPNGNANNSNNRNSNTATHMQQGQRLLRMIYAEKERTNAERDKLKHALAERDKYRDHYVSICEASKWRRMQFEELEGRFEVMQVENAELRKKVKKNRHNKRRDTLEVDTQIAALQQQYVDELQRQKQKRHHEKKLRLRQEKEFELIVEQKQQQQQQLSPQPSTSGSVSHEQCQKAAAAAVKSAYMNAKKQFDAEIEELEIQTVALMLENRDLKNANSSLRHSLYDMEQKLSAAALVVGHSKKIITPANNKSATKSLPSSPAKKASAWAQTDEKDNFNVPLRVAAARARDVATSTSKLNAAASSSVATFSPAANSKLPSRVGGDKLSPLTFGDVHNDSNGSSKHLSPSQQLVAPSHTNINPNENYDAISYSGIYSETNDDGEMKEEIEAAAKTTRQHARKSFASSTPARHLQPLQPPTFITTGAAVNNNNVTSAVKPSSPLKQHVTLLRSLSSAATSADPLVNNNTQSPIGALRQQLQRRSYNTTNQFTRQIVETSFTTSTPRTNVREVASDDYLRAAHLLAASATTTHHKQSFGPVSSRSEHHQQRNSSHQKKAAHRVASVAETGAGKFVVSSAATGDEGDDETEQGAARNASFGGAGDVELETDEKGVAGEVTNGESEHSVSGSGRRRLSRRHVYELMEDNNINYKAHGDVVSADAGSETRFGRGLVMPKAVASVAARRLERKIALLKGHGSAAALSTIDGSDNNNNNNNNNSSNTHVRSQPAPYYDPSYWEMKSSRPQPVPNNNNIIDADTGYALAPCIGTSV